MEAPTEVTGHVDERATTRYCSGALGQERPLDWVSSKREPHSLRGTACIQVEFATHMP